MAVPGSWESTAELIENLLPGESVSAASLALVVRNVKDLIRVGARIAEDTSQQKTAAMLRTHLLTYAPVIHELAQKGAELGDPERNVQVAMLAAQAAMALEWEQDEMDFPRLYGVLQRSMRVLQEVQHRVEADYPDVKGAVEFCLDSGRVVEKEAANAAVTASPFRGDARAALRREMPDSVRASLERHRQDEEQGPTRGPSI